LGIEKQSKLLKMLIREAKNKNKIKAMKIQGKKTQNVMTP
jgi:hypothetical protein